MGQPTAASMTALEKRNAMVKHARELGIPKPHTMKNAELELVIKSVEDEIARRKAERDAEGDPFDEIDPSLEGDHLEETVQDAVKAREATREAWLMSAVELLTPLLAQAGASNIPNRVISVSVGFPAKSVRKTIGQCWSALSSADGKTNHMFISPLLDDGVKVLGTLAHEMIHADDNCASQHAGHFRKVATALGLTGKMTATEVGPDLEPVLKDMLVELGEYPHVKLNLGDVKKQTTRLLKGVCGDNECPLMDDKGSKYTVRLTAKWINVGLPSCPCGHEMIVEES